MNLCCHCLAHPVSSDTMFANTVSRRENRCAQVNPRDFGWARAFLMAFRSEAHESLSYLFGLLGMVSCWLLFVTMLRK